jgi:CRP-like cAMP-binding protein
MSESILRTVYLFKEFSSVEIETLQKLVKEKSYSPGQDIFIRGEPATSLFIIRFGSVKIYSTTRDGDEVQISTQGLGSHFGELPLLDGQNRSATAQAIESCTLLEINYQDLKNILNNNNVLESKFYKSLANYLCARLRATTDDLNHAQETKLRHF